MPYRMFDYGCCIAEECQKSIGTYDKFVFPRQLVLFIEEDEKFQIFFPWNCILQAGIPLSSTCRKVLETGCQSINEKKFICLITYTAF